MPAVRISLELGHLGLQHLQIVGDGFVCLFELTDPRVQHPLRDAKPLGHLNYRMTSNDDLLDRFILEFRGVFRPFRLYFSISVFTSLFVY